ncbi:MAG: GNAT family N-acetyltransferase [Spirochaetaceae bacterium]
MIKVKKIDKNRSLNIVSNDNPSFSGIVTGKCKGSMWVNNIENPTIALTYSFAVGGYCILGNPGQDSVYEQLHNFLIKELFPKLKKRGEEFFEFSVESLESQKCILELFSDKIIESEDEYFYIKTDKTKSSFEVPVEYSILKVDSKFIDELEHHEYQNRVFLEERLLESWGSYEDFLNESIAYVALYKKRIVAVIVGTATFNNIIPIDIETEKQHRNRGLASILTTCLVNNCIDKQLMPQWNCVDSNNASKKTALKSGFEFMKKSPFFWLKI